MLEDRGTTPLEEGMGIKVVVGEVVDTREGEVVVVEVLQMQLHQALLMG